MPTLVSHPDEVKILSRRFGQGAASLDRYLELDGYTAVQRAIENGPEWVITEMKVSGLRGRGGAGFPHRPQVVLRPQGLRQAQVRPRQRR